MEVSQNTDQLDLDQSGESLEEMGNAIDAVNEMKLYNLMGEEIKTFQQEETYDLLHLLNISPTYKGVHPLILAEIA